MAVSPKELEDFLEIPALVLVLISFAKGSTPREKDAWMLVSPDLTLGTIGGGQVEFSAIDTARQMLRGGEASREIDLALGPEIGQCCGGRMGLYLQLVSLSMADELKQRLGRERDNFPSVYIMGAGHVGRALAVALAPLPLKTIVVDTREMALINLAPNVESRLSALPEAEVRAAPGGSAFVVLTHDHALDFMIVREALARRDAAYVGMIGSKTKRATFLGWMKKQGLSKEHGRALICPIGGDNPFDKRPEVIAALVVGEILLHIGQPGKNESGKTDLRHEFLGGN